MTGSLWLRSSCKNPVAVRAGRQGTCEHGRPPACFTRHARADPRIGQPLCPDCYDYDAHVVWNNAAGELWRRTKQAIERHLAALARARGMPPVWISCGNDRHRAIAPVRVSHGKAAGFQARAAVRFHALLHLNGVHPDDLDAVIPPPTGITVADLDDAIRQAATTIAFTTASHPDRPGGWLIPWGDQVDVRVITMRGENTVTDAMVAAYLAKYSTKGTEATGHASARITDNTIDLYSSSGGSHVARRLPPQRDHRARTRPDTHCRPCRRRDDAHYREPLVRRNRAENYRRRAACQHRR